MEIPDTFVTQIIDTGGGLKISIPTKLVTYMGLKQGDMVKILIKKQE